MSNLKLTDYENGSSTFTFPYNPNSIEFVSTKFLDQRNYPYSFTFLGMTSPIKSSITIGLNGHFDSTNKNSNYRSLVKKVSDPILLMLYFENSYGKFYLCTGTNVQKVPTGARPLHVDYVANFFSPFGILFDGTQQDGLRTASTKTNDGDMVTPIEKITGSVTSGQIVKIGDVNNNGFKFTATQTGTMTYYIAKVVTEDNVFYSVEYGYVEISDGGTPANIEAQTLQNYSTSGDILLKLEPDESLTDVFGSSGVNIDNITPTFYFRNGWSSD